jgi:hypothetical protein
VTIPQLRTHRILSVLTIFTHILLSSSLTLFGSFSTVFGGSEDDDLSLDNDQGENMKDVCPDEEIPLGHWQHPRRQVECQRRLPDLD